MQNMDAWVNVNIYSKYYMLLKKLQENVIEMKMEKPLGFISLLIIILITALLTFGPGLCQDETSGFRNDTSEAWTCRHNISDPTDIEAASIAKLNEGVKFFGQKRYDEALEAYDEAIVLNPRYAEAWNNKGLALYHLGRHVEAIQAYNMAIELNPRLADSWGNKGDSLKALLKYDEAIQAYNKAIELDSQWAGPWVGKCLVLNNQRKADEADQACNKAIELDSQNALAWYAKGDAILNLGMCDEAVQSYDKAINLSQNGSQEVLPYAWGHKSIALQILGRFNDANAASIKAKELGYRG